MRIKINDRRNVKGTGVEVLERYDSRGAIVLCGDACSVLLWEKRQNISKSLIFIFKVSDKKIAMVLNHTSNLQRISLCL